MKIKSLLLGSAAALIAVSGAQAADAVMVEPEPVEYVRICDAYGAGFFYIPGTETCLKFSGYVRVTYRANHYHDEDVTTAAQLPDTHRHRIRYRGRFNIDARNETEWGTLRSQLRFQGGDYGADFSADDVFSDGHATYHNQSDAPVGIDRALISLAGFRLGYSDDYWTTIGGYGYYTAVNDGFYSYGQATFLDYTYAADGFTLTAGLQVGSGNSTFGTLTGSGLAGQPDLYIGGDYSGSWGRVYGTMYYDSSNEGTAYKVGFHWSLADYIPGGSLGAWWMADDGETDYVHGHAFGITTKMDLSDSWLLYAGYSNWDARSCPLGAGFCATGGLTNWTIGTQWKMAPGLNTKFEYSKWNDEDEMGVGQFVVRVTRSF